MNRILGFTLFFLLFLAIYGGMHLYVFTRLSGMLGIKRGVAFYITLICALIAFPIATFLERTMDGVLARWFYMSSATWFGALFLLLATLIIYEGARLAFNIDKKAAALGIIILVTVLVVYGIINASFVHVTELEIPINGLEKELRIVQLSDIHVGTINGPEYLQMLVDKTNELQADMVLITGDIVDGSGPLSPGLFTPLERLKAKSFFVTGNHENYEGLDKVLPMISAAGPQILHNEFVTYKGIQIVGIDNPDEFSKKQDKIISTIPFEKGKPTILMYHIPQGLEDAQAAGVNLQLSGHTHNGQIMPFNLISMMVFPRIRGLYEYKGTYQYTTSGSGTWGPPMRIGTRSEITLIRLKAK